MQKESRWQADFEEQLLDALAKMLLLAGALLLAGE